MRMLNFAPALAIALSPAACANQGRDVGQATTTSAEIPDVTVDVDLKPPVAPVVIVGTAPREPAAGEPRAQR